MSNPQLERFNALKDPYERQVAVLHAFFFEALGSEVNELHPSILHMLSRTLLETGDILEIETPPLHPLFNLNPSRLANLMPDPQANEGLALGIEVREIHDSNPYFKDRRLPMADYHHFLLVYSTAQEMARTFVAMQSPSLKPLLLMPRREAQAYPLGEQVHLSLENFAGDYWDHFQNPQTPMPPPPPWERQEMLGI